MATPVTRFVEHPGAAGLPVPPLATLNGARQAVSRALEQEPELGWSVQGEAKRMGVSLFTVAELGALWVLKRFDRD
jgi:hypothetical protein